MIQRQNFVPTSGKKGWQGRSVFLSEIRSRSYLLKILTEAMSAEYSFLINYWPLITIHRIGNRTDDILATGCSHTSDISSFSELSPTFLPLASY